MVRCKGRLIFVRHGETDWNREGRLQGQSETRLNALGRQQAAAAGRMVLSLMRPPLRFVSSPLLRACESMEIIRSAMCLRPCSYETEDRLKELSFGTWEGSTRRELKTQDPQAMARCAGDKWGFVPPGGESYGMAASRIKPWLEGVACDTLLVSHGGVARVIMALIGSVSRSQAPTTEVWQGRVLVFEDGAFTWT